MSDSFGALLNFILVLVVHIARIIIVCVPAILWLVVTGAYFAVYLYAAGKLPNGIPYSTLPWLSAVCIIPLLWLPITFMYVYRIKTPYRKKLTARVFFLSWILKGCGVIFTILLQRLEGIENPGQSSDFLWGVFYLTIGLYFGQGLFFSNSTKDVPDRQEVPSGEYEISYDSSVTEEPPAPVFGNSEDAARLANIITTYYPGGWLKIIDNDDTILDIRLSEYDKTEAILELSGPQISHLYGSNQIWVAKQVLPVSETIDAIENLDGYILDLYNRLKRNEHTWNAEILQV